MTCMWAKIKSDACASCMLCCIIQCDQRVDIQHQRWISHISVGRHFLWECFSWILICFVREAKNLALKQHYIQRLCCCKVTCSFHAYKSLVSTSHVWFAQSYLLISCIQITRKYFTCMIRNRIITSLCELRASLRWISPLASQSAHISNPACACVHVFLAHTDQIQPILSVCVCQIRYAEKTQIFMYLSHTAMKCMMHTLQYLHLSACICIHLTSRDRYVALRGAVCVFISNFRCQHACKYKHIGREHRCMYLHVSASIFSSNTCTYVHVFDCEMRADTSSFCLVGTNTWLSSFCLVGTNTWITRFFCYQPVMDPEIEKADSAMELFNIYPAAS